MANLTETAYYTRRAINWTILAVIGYIVLRIFWGVLVIAWFIIFPPQAPPPNNAFGKLPALKFPVIASESAQLTYQIETIDGTLPTASTSAAVYFMPKNAPNLLGLNKAQEFAQEFQFDPTPIQESKNIYRFNDLENPLRRLRYDIISKNFIIRYAFERDASLFIEKNFTSAESLKLEAYATLESNGLLHDDIEDANASITYLRLLGDQLIPTTSLSQSDAVRIDFFRKNIGETPVLTPSFEEAPISIILSGAGNIKKRTLQFAYTYWPIDYFTSATYAVKTTALAWDELQQGKGFIARYPKNTTVAVIRNVYLAYYDSFDPQTYLQPIFVFEGDNGFVGYVPAITSEWVE
jgi:hypothetical protein